MNSQSSFPVADSQRSPEARPKAVVASDTQEPSESSDEDPLLARTNPVENLLRYVGQLSDQDRLLFMQQLIRQLSSTQLQSMCEIGQQELTSRRHCKLTATSIPRETALTLKKDYTYQDRGLSEPTQYYVYLRRRKPKLDRYIGTLFYVPTGCALTYVSDTDGHLVFQTPNNIFQLTDAKDSSLTKIVRLIRLEPPPANYTFTKQQQDTPAIHLRVEYLQPHTLMPIAEHCLPFPSCMHEGGVLDRYRWDVTLIQPNPEPVFPTANPPLLAETLVDRVLANQPFAPPAPNSQPLNGPLTSGQNQPLSQVSTFYLTNPANISRVLERMQLWVSWSEQAMPQSPWAIAQTETVYTLMNAAFQRSILSLLTADASVSLHGSLPVIVKWFRDLSLAVSQAQSQEQANFTQLKLAHNLFVDMSLPQTDPCQLLKTLFGTEFAKNL